MHDLVYGPAALDDVQATQMSCQVRRLRQGQTAQLETSRRRHDPDVAPFSLIGVATSRPQGGKRSSIPMHQAD